MRDKLIAQLRRAIGHGKTTYVAPARKGGQRQWWLQTPDGAAIEQVVARVRECLATDPTATADEPGVGEGVVQFDVENRRVSVVRYGPSAAIDVYVTL